MAMTIPQIMPTMTMRTAARKLRIEAFISIPPVQLWRATRVSERRFRRNIGWATAVLFRRGTRPQALRLQGGRWPTAIETLSWLHDLERLDSINCRLLVGYDALA